MRKGMTGGVGATLEPIRRLDQDKFLKKAYCCGKLRNGAATRRAYGRGEESWNRQVRICRLQDWSKRGELLGEEEVTGQNPWVGKGDGFRAQMQDPSFARRGMHPHCIRREEAWSRGRKVCVSRSEDEGIFLPDSSPPSRPSGRSFKALCSICLLTARLQRLPQRRESWEEAVNQDRDEWTCWSHTAN